MNMPYIPIEDIKMYYHVVGDLNNDKKNIVFLHGGAGMADHTIYISFWSKFAHLVNLVFIDQRGCGRTESGDPEKWNLMQNGADVFLFCEALGINKPIIAGVSWGGYVAISYGIQFSSHPLALILCNTEGRVSSEARFEAFLRVANMDAANAVKAFDTNWNQFTNAEYFKHCLPFYAKKPYTSSELAGCIQHYELWEKYMKTEHGKFDFNSKLHHITCPVLYLAGENDPVHPSVCAVKTASDIGENCQLIVLKDSGDPVYRDTPEEASRLILEFLDSFI